MNQEVWNRFESQWQAFVREVNRLNDAMPAMRERILAEVEMRERAKKLEDNAQPILAEMLRQFQEMQRYLNWTLYI